MTPLLAEALLPLVGAACLYAAGVLLTTTGYTSLLRVLYGAGAFVVMAAAAIAAIDLLVIAVGA